ncbi:MAG: hypothetical protein KF880_01405 [Ferruginibacter sp.]|nr:hypothetical protein [Ferruginibacter sp.]
MKKKLYLFLTLLFGVIYSYGQKEPNNNITSKDTSIVCEIKSIGKTRESELELIGNLIIKGEIVESNFSSSVNVKIDTESYYFPINIKDSNKIELKELMKLSDAKIKIYCTFFPLVLSNNTEDGKRMSPLMIINKYEVIN